LDAQYFTLLEKALQNEYVPHLPPLLDTKKPLEEQAKKNLSRAFSAFALSDLCGISPSEAAKAVVDDFDDYGIDAVYYHAPAETLYLIQAKLKATAMFELAEALKFCQGIRKIVRQEFDSFNAHVQSRKIDIEGALENCNHIALVIAHIGSGVSQNAKNALIALLSEDEPEDERLEKDYRDFDGARTIASLVASKAMAKVDVTLTIQKCQSVSDPRQTYFGLIKLTDLVNLHSKYGAALYARNIRTYLGHKTDVNIAIRETLEQRPEMFFYLNNGVTMLADTIEPKDNSKSAGKRLKMRGVSVINGAQTIATSAAFRDANPTSDLSKAKVLLTIVKESSDREFGKSVTRARNHQNQVTLANFAALDDQQERLRCEVAYFGLNYSYKAAAPDTINDPTRIRLDEAVQALAMFHSDPRFAVWIKKEPSILLETEKPPYQALFDGNLTGLRLANVVRVNRYIQARMKQEERGSSGHDRTVYKHINFVVAWILAKQTRDAVQGAGLVIDAKLTTELSKPFDNLRQISLDQINKFVRGPLAVCRNQGETIPLLERIMIQHFLLAADPAVDFKKKQQKLVQPYPVDLFNYLVSKAPQIGNLA
jgi:hypothetical protein